MPNHVPKDDLNDLKWMAYVRAGVKARFEPEKNVDIADCGEKARAIISEHLKAKGVYHWILIFKRRWIRLNQMKLLHLVWSMLSNIPSM